MRREKQCIWNDSTIHVYVKLTDFQEGGGQFNSSHKWEQGTAFSKLLYFLDIFSPSNFIRPCIVFAALVAMSEFPQIIFALPHMRGYIAPKQGVASADRAPRVS